MLKVQFVKFEEEIEGITIDQPHRISFDTTTLYTKYTKVAKAMYAALKSNADIKVSSKRYGDGKYYISNFEFTAKD